MSFAAVSQTLRFASDNTSEKPAEPAAAEPAAKAQEQPKIDYKSEESKKIASLEKQVKESGEKIAELRKDILYSAAEIENVRRIGREDVEKARNFAVTSFAKDMIDVVDILEKAVEAFGKLPQAELDGNKLLASICTGVKMSGTVLAKNLAKHGVEKMETKAGDKFDPNRHEALFKSPVTELIKEDCIASILKPGFLLKERVIRAAQVGVAEKE